MAKLIEAEKIQAIGGLSEDDRSIPGINEMVDYAVPFIAKFRECMAGTTKPSTWLRNAKSVCGNLREANSETTLGFLLRKGIQVVANDWYQFQPRAWQQYCEVASSTTVAEWYAPMYGSVIAGPVAEGDPFPEGKIVGENSYIKNRKFGIVESFTRELFEDDQTGQIKQRSQHLGASMAVLESVWASSRFLGSARTYANVTVPAATYSTTNTAGTAITTPFSTTLYTGSSGNIVSNIGPLNMGRLKEAYQVLLNAVDPNNNKVIVNPNCLLHSNQEELNAKMLLQAGYYPAIPGPSNTALANAPILGGTTSAIAANQGVPAGYPGGGFAANPFDGMGIKHVRETYLADWVCALGQAGKGLIFQERDPLEIVPEAPNSGASFTFDVLRYKARRRFDVEWIGGGSRFWCQINDGTVTTGQQ